ncbi:MAG: CHC2 zinc finger domain-containing protein [Synergistaceae bacterium]
MAIIKNIKNDVGIGELRYLIGHITKTLSLPDFIESETGQDLHWIMQDQSARCCCPLHEEDQPSFNMILKDNTWVYHCFGCGAKGNIIHFCKDLHGLRNKLEAVHYLCQKYKIENTSDLILEGIKKVGVRIDAQRVMENANILVSNQCRMLLRKNFKLHKEWVSSAYKRLNDALDRKDKKEIDKIGYEASNRIHIKEENRELSV